MEKRQIFLQAWAGKQHLFPDLSHVKDCISRPTTLKYILWDLLVQAMDLLDTERLRELSLETLWQIAFATLNAIDEKLAESHLPSRSRRASASTDGG